MKSRIKQFLIDWCEERGQRTKSIRLEIFWHKLSWWILGA